jgi:hypothetical protein
MEQCAVSDNVTIDNSQHEFALLFAHAGPTCPPSIVQACGSCVPSVAHYARLRVTAWGRFGPDGVDALMAPADALREQIKDSAAD